MNEPVARRAEAGLIGDPVVLLRAVEAFQALAVRLWCNDRPSSNRIEAIDRWAHALPEDEHAALNAMLGENFGADHPWDGRHAISRLIVQLDETREAGDD